MLHVYVDESAYDYTTLELMVKVISCINSHRISSFSYSFSKCMISHCVCHFIIRYLQDCYSWEAKSIWEYDGFLNSIHLEIKELTWENR